MNYYCELTATDTIPCSQEDYEALKEVMIMDEDADYHNIDIELHEGMLHMFSEEFAEVDLLPEAAIKKIGEIITKAGLPHWEVGIAFTASRRVPGSGGGTYARFTPDGRIIHPTLTWPE